MTLCQHGEWTGHARTSQSEVNKQTITITRTCCCGLICLDPTKIGNLLICFCSFDLSSSILEKDNFY